MMGVLVVETPQGNTAFLSAFSGMLGGQWQVEGFVPPAFEVNERNEFLPAGEQQLERLRNRHHQIAQSESARTTRKTLAQQERAYLESTNCLKHLLRERKRQRSLQRLSEAGVAMPSEDSDSVEQQRTTRQQLDDQSRQDKRELKQHHRDWRIKLSKTRASVESLQLSADQLKQQHKSLSRNLQEQVFQGYRLLNSKLESEPMNRFFPASLPPGGTGDCAAIKLLQACYQRRLKPVCLGEFWWGATPAGGIRHHAHYYPACRGKCRPLLPFMLSGLDVDLPDYEKPVFFPSDEPRTVYEDEHLVVVEKPAGMLSVPGIALSDSVETRLRSRYHDSCGNLLAHRLDQATSGLLLAGRSDAVRSQLQRQFQQRRVEKRYTAMLSAINIPGQGRIELPLRTDIDDRPRQCVCRRYGKKSLTRYKVIERFPDKTRIALYPVTGRTHQLRVHAAHPDGLNAPVIGDELYGVVVNNELPRQTQTGKNRLHLHAEYIAFSHPVSARPMSFTSLPPF